MVKTHPGTDTIEEDIHATRQRIDDKVDRIRQRLSPGDLIDSVIEVARNSGGTIAGGVGRTVRDHPLPVAMIGAGALWLALANLGPSTEEEGVSESARVPDDEPAATKRRQRTRQDAGEVRGRATPSHGHFIQEHPVLVGAAGVVLGATLAATLPRTKREDSVFSEPAERFKETAKDAAVKEGRHVKEAAKSAVERAREAAERKTSGAAGREHRGERSAGPGNAH